LARSIQDLAAVIWAAVLRMPCLEILSLPYSL
jgi:hypothetical protein